MPNKIIIPLILKYRKGDPNAFIKIYEVFERLIICYSSKMCCEDGKSELTLFLLELLHRLDLSRFENDDSYLVQKYIVVALRNRYIDISRKGRTDVNNMRFFAEVDVSFEERTDEKLIMEDIFSILNRKQKQVLKYKLCGYSDKEIAKLMGITRQAVNGIKLRAFDTIKNYYK